MHDLAICSGVCNSRRFHTKLRSMDAKVLSRSFCVKTARSHTAITSIVIHFTNQILNDLSLRVLAFRQGEAIYFSDLRILRESRLLYVNLNAIFIDSLLNYCDSLPFRFV